MTETCPPQWFQWDQQHPELVAELQSLSLWKLPAAVVGVLGTVWLSCPSITVPLPTQGWQKGIYDHASPSVSPVAKTPVRMELGWLSLTINWLTAMDCWTRPGPGQSRQWRAVNLKHCSSFLGSMFGMCKGFFQSKQSSPHTAEKIAGNCKQGELLFVISSSFLPHVLQDFCVLNFLWQKFVVAPR